MNDEAFMALALAEAVKAVGRTHPNPAVGAVLVKNGKVISSGFTSPVGGPHAEAIALALAGKKAKGATLYVTLEPCNHFGRTPPCSEAVIAAGVKRVVFGARDVNPKVNGKGARRLKAAGIEVVEGVLKDASMNLNHPFFRFMTTGLPWVTVKVGVTLDGKIATSTGKSKWISSEASRVVVHQLRDTIDAILVGAGTVIADDPLLTTRREDSKRARNPVRVVIDPNLRTDPKSAIYDTKIARTILATRKPAPKHAERGTEVWPFTTLEALMRSLAAEGLLHVMVEGGAATHAEFIKAGLVDELVMFMGPKLFGHDGKTWSGMLGVTEATKPYVFDDLEAVRVGPDLMVTARRRATSTSKSRSRS